MNGVNPQAGGSGSKSDTLNFFNDTDMNDAIEKAENVC
jgi:hypothetical protein